jgi:hypothetical protein
MSNRTSVLPLGFGLSAVICFAGASPADEAPRPPRPPVRVYTNDDLERVHPFRAETGVDSVPAAAPTTSESRATRGSAGRSHDTARGHGEEYWRREARKVRDRMRALVEQAETLRARIDAREQAQRRSSRSGRRSAATAQDATAALRGRLVALERRMRELEEDLADRARREGALPGWLR